MYLSGSPDQGNIRDPKLMYSAEVEPVFYENVEHFKKTLDKPIGLDLQVQTSKNKITKMLYHKDFLGEYYYQNNLKRLEKRKKTTRVFSLDLSPKRKNILLNNQKDFHLETENPKKKTRKYVLLKDSSSKKVLARSESTAVTNATSPQLQTINPPKNGKGVLLTGLSLYKSIKRKMNDYDRERSLSLSDSSRKRLLSNSNSLMDVMESGKQILTKCKNSIEQGNQLDQKIHKENKRIYQPKTIKVDNTIAKVIEPEKINYDNILKGVKNVERSHATEVEKLDTITKLSEKMAYLYRKSYFQEVDNFSSNPDFIFDNEVEKIREQIFLKKRREKYQMKQNLKDAIEKVVDILDKTQKAKDRLLNSVSPGKK